MYVQYGCGHSAPEEWINFDISPTLRIQKTPILGSILKPKLNTTFPKNVRYGDIIKGLPIAENSCDGVYCSHTLEHLSLNDFRRALKNSYKILKQGGIFRCIVPDLECAARNYVTELDKGKEDANMVFLNTVLLGITERPRGIKGLAKSFFGNANHLWMWDSKSLAKELENVGFREVRECKFNDCSDNMFKYVEENKRFVDAVAIECVK